MPHPDALKEARIRALNSLEASKTLAPAFLFARRNSMWIAAAFFLLGAFCLFWRGPMPFVDLIRAFARMDALAGAVSMAASPATIRHFYALSLGTSLLFVAACILALAVWARLGEDARDVISRLTFTLAISGALIIYLTRMEVGSFWMPVGLVMRNPTALPIFGHRLLFVWIAKGFQLTSPRISDLQGFYLSQCLAILLTVYVLGRWSALYVGKAFSWVGQILGGLMISTCFSYHNFYDIGTVLFTTCGLMAIYSRKYWWLVPTVLIGTFNYEGLLLLIPVAAFLAYDTDPPRRWIPPLTASLIVYGAVRFALQAFIPFSRGVDWRIWSNIVDPFLNARQMAYSVTALLGWYALGLMNLRYCDSRVKRMLLLFPLVFAVTFLFGQLHEPRQFNAFIPVVVAILLSGFRWRLESQGRSASPAQAFLL